MRRAIAIVLGVVVTLGALVAVAVLVLTQTQFGHAQVRKIAMKVVRGPVHGVVHIGRIDGDLLRGLVVDTLSITDSSGAPLIATRHAALHYTLGDLLHKRLYFDHVRLEHPIIVLEQSQAGVWNFQRIFPSNPNAPKDTTPSWGSWITFRDLQITDGEITVHQPWHPDSTLTGPARDSAIRAALDTSARPNIVAVAGNGYEKITEVHALTTTMPLVRLADPRTPAKLAQIASLRADIAAFRPPAARVRDLAGTFSFTADSIWWPTATVTLPASHLVTRGSYGFTTGNLTLGLRAHPAALNDVRFLDPHLPIDGHAGAEVTMRWRGKTQRYTVRDLAFERGAERASGRLGIEMGDSLGIFDTDLRFSGIDTHLIETVVPGTHIPQQGVLAGHAILAGGMHDLAIDTDILFDDDKGADSHVTIVGGLGLAQANGARTVRTRSLAITLDPLQLALAKVVKPSFPVGGTLTGHATVDGSTLDSMRATADLTHRYGRAYTHLTGTGGVAFAPAAAASRIASLDAAITFDTLNLGVVRRFAPATQLRGTVSGPVTVSGPMQHLTIHSALAAPTGGTFGVDGTVDLASKDIGYTLTVATQSFDARAITALAPHTAVTGTASATGRGTKPATMQAQFAADIRASVYDSVHHDTAHVDTAHVRVGVANGVVHVDSSHLRAFATSVDVHGSFGLDSGRDGELTYRVAADSLEAFRLFLQPSDTGVVAPRPARLAAAIERARADSERIAKATEVERAIRGTPPPTLAVDSPRVLRRDSLAGHAVVAGTVRGSTQRFELTGDLDASRIAALGNSIRAARAQYEWHGGPSLASPLVLAVQLDTVSAAGLELDTIDARLEYHKPDGSFVLLLRNGEGQEYSAATDFTFSPDAKSDTKELRYSALGLRLDSTTWHATHAGSVRWGPHGIEVRRVELTSDARQRRVAADGTLPLGAPPDTPARFALAIENFPVGALSSLAESDLDVSAVLSMRADLSGTAATPKLDGAASMTEGTVRDIPVPNVRLRFAYDTTTLLASARLDRDSAVTARLARSDPRSDPPGDPPAAPPNAPDTADRPLLVTDAAVPINLAFNATGPRLLDRPLRATLKSDSIPLGLIPVFTPSVSTAQGRGHAMVTVGGTPHAPTIAGDIVLADGLFHIVPTGVTFTNVATNVRFTHDTIVVDSLVARSEGWLRAHGTLDISDRSLPVLDLTTSAHNARVLKNRTQGTLDIDDSLSMAGPVSAPYLSGSVLVRDGVIYIPDVNRKSPLGLSGPNVTYVADTADPAIKKVVPTESSLIKNLLMDVDLSVNQNTWVRNKDANVEVSTDAPLTVRTNQNHAMVVDGSVTTERGQYTFFSKRFEITRGTATFIGTTQLDPTVQATGQYTVAAPGRQPLNILVLIAGTVKQPTLTLSSDAQPPLSQTDLFTLLAFGSPASQLTAGGGAASSSAGGASASGLGAANLAGAVGPYVAQRLAGVAIGTLTQELQGDLGRSIGADVFNITPAPGVPTDVSAKGVTGYVRNTELEFGKYMTPQTYVGLDLTPIAPPGARVQRQIGRRSVVSLTLLPWYLADPTLSPTTDIITKDVLGVSLSRQWRF